MNYKTQYEIASADLANHKAINYKLKKQLAQLIVLIGRIEYITQNILDGTENSNNISKILELIKRDKLENLNK